MSTFQASNIQTRASPKLWKYLIDRLVNWHFNWQKQKDHHEMQWISEKKCMKHEIDTYVWIRWHGKLSWMNTSKFDMNCFQDRPDSPFMNAFMYTSVSLKSTSMIFYNKDFSSQNRKSVQKLFLFHQRKIANLGQALTTSIEGSLLFKSPWDQIVPPSLIAFPAFHDAVKSAPSS